MTIFSTAELSSASWSTRELRRIFSFGIVRATPLSSAKRLFDLFNCRKTALVSKSNPNGNNGMLYVALMLQYFTICIRRIVAEYLLKVVNHIVVGGRGVAHDEIYRVQLGYFLYGGFGHIAVEASHQIVVIYQMDGLARYLSSLDLGREFYAEVILAESSMPRSSITWNNRSSPVRSAFTFSLNSDCCVNSCGV